MTAAFSVLVVDDEARIVEMLRLVLERHGVKGVDIRVRTAGSAEEALAAMRDAPADLVLTDHRMAGASGADLLATVRDEFPAVPRVLMTGYQEIAEEDALERAAPATVVRKPFDVGDIRATVLRLLSAPR